MSFYLRTGRVERKTGMGRFKVTKIPKILGTNMNTLFRGGLLLRSEILVRFNSGVYNNPVNIIYTDLSNSV